jgi:2-hydroxycyclohexanecarboxyl-CoA dehydrogenase
MSGLKIAAGVRGVVTGAGSGIGRATALRFARQGADVVCVDIDAEAAVATADECGGDASARQCDVSDAAAVAALAAEVEANLGPVDVLVNNAGVGVGGPFLDASVEDWDWLMGVNLNGVAYGSHAFGARMVSRGRGHVVNIASGAAYIMSRDLAAYCASKAAVVALSRCLRADWASAGVGVSAICPGVINTPIAAHSRMVGSLAARADRAAEALRFGHSPDLVAKAIVRAVEKNRELVPVGLESELAYRLLPFVPGPIKGLATRTPLHRLVV